MKYKLIYVEWYDATSQDSWEDIEIAKKHLSHTIKTCGFLISETNMNLTISLNIDEEGEVCSCTITIPKSLIYHRVPIEIMEEATSIN